MEGVSLNVSNRYDTESVARFGEELSDLIGDREYIVDTSRNGFVAPATETAAVANDWCNRPDQALGEQAVGTMDPELYPHIAAMLWIKPPGESDGNQVVFPNQDCHGETSPPGIFSPRQARQLIINDRRRARVGTRSGACGHALIVTEVQQKVGWVWRCRTQPVSSRFAQHRRATASHRLPPASAPTGRSTTSPAAHSRRKKYL